MHLIYPVRVAIMHLAAKLGFQDPLPMPVKVPTAVAVYKKWDITATTPQFTIQDSKLNISHANISFIELWEEGDHLI